MKIFIDGDACPVTDIVVSAAAEFGLEAVLVHSTSHFGNTAKYGGIQKIMVDNESQAADMAIINRVAEGDIVVTGDYGLASLALAKKAAAISFHGKIYDENNIDRLLFERHLYAVMRRSGEKHKGPAKRRAEDDEQFRAVLKKLILQILKDI